MAQFESQHVDWQRGAMNQIAALSGGGLVASASLLWPQAPLPNPGVIAVAWASLALATVAAVLANYLSVMGNTFISMSSWQTHKLNATPVPAETRAIVEKWIVENEKKGSRRTGLAGMLHPVAPMLFALGVLLLATWAILSILV